MSVINISYPVTDEARKALYRLPLLSASFTLPQSGRSECEIVRLLLNTHYNHIRHLLEFIEKWFERSGPIGLNILKAKHPFHFAQTIAELYLFAHLRERLENVEAPESDGGPVCPDIKLEYEGSTVKIELFTPVDLMGFQLFENYVPSILKYLDVPRGYHLKVKIESIDKETEYSGKALYYPYTIPNENETHSWLEEFARLASEWLNRSEPEPELCICGPGEEVLVAIELVKACKDPGYRDIILQSATRSTDTRLFFEVGSVEDTVRTQWGQKLRRKLKKQQCGPPSDDVLRILIVNFSMAHAAWPDFICKEPFTSRFQQTIKHIVAKNMPYDIVLPARLSSACCFGKPVLLTDTWHSRGTAFIKKVGLDTPCPPPRYSPPKPEEIVEMAKFRFGVSPTYGE